MTITNGYATLAEVKASDILNISDTNSDTTLEVIIEAASRNIDHYCRRFFYQTASQSRYYTAHDRERLEIDDVQTTSGFALATDDAEDGTYSTIWSSSDYVLSPFNALLDSQPYTEILIAPAGAYDFTEEQVKGVKVTATFGWTATPSPIKEACKMLSARLFKRLSTPLGSQSMTALGMQTLQIPEFDNDIKLLLFPYVKNGI